MDVVFVAVVLVLFVGVCALLKPVGGEGERDLAQHRVFLSVPLHHA